MAYEMPKVEGVSLRHRFVPARGMNFHVAEAGEGEPVLLLHGWPQHWWCWRLVIPALAERHRVLAMDLRGFGWSDIAWEGFEKESMAEDVVAVLDELGVDRVRLAGHDWGAWIGYLLAIRHPERLERLAALSVPPPFVMPTPRTLARLPRLSYQLGLASPLAVRRQRRPSYVARKIRRWAHARSELRRDVQRLYARDLRASTRARATTLLYRTFLTRELGPVLAGRYRDERITVPTLIMHGRRDPVLPPALYEGHEPYFDELTVEQVPRAGHFLPEERAELVAERLLGFFGSREPQPPHS